MLAFAHQCQINLTPPWKNKGLYTSQRTRRPAIYSRDPESPTMLLWILAGRA